MMICLYIDVHAHDSLERNPSLSRRCKEGRKMHDSPHLEVMTLAPMGGFVYAKMPVCQAYMGFVLEEKR